MKNAIFSYIEFLLPTHNCVIVPEFGAFIVNMETSKLKINGSFTPPTYKVVFNQDLKHNDGLLSSCIYKNENISYNAACLKINNAVNDLRKELIQNKLVKCGNIGQLQVDTDNNIYFTSNSRIIHPSLYGLSTLELSRLPLLTNVSTHKSVRHTLTNIAAASAAILLLVIPSMKVNQSSNKIQQADFSYSLVNTLFSTKKNTDTLSVTTDTQNKIEQSNQKGEAIETDIAKESITAAPIRKYYIIIGGEETSTKANTILDKIKKEDFPNAAIVESADRYRIYVASFTEKQEAESFLEMFRNENPKYETAWLYSKRSK